ncbi:hypothetical protein [Burkholderia sp. IMCC1007]|uniref:hypothetical protein n=1 Tax=Burkholderia sp. IMCC1007 TaxID=3004104 RepID=UPI0022B59A47|nr:hypothetical protein [Burkholderia sp. IMCC1007]
MSIVRADIAERNDAMRYRVSELIAFGGRTGECLVYMAEGRLTSNAILLDAIRFLDASKHHKVEDRPVDCEVARADGGKQASHSGAPRIVLMGSHGVSPRSRARCFEFRVAIS